MKSNIEIIECPEMNCYNGRYEDTITGFEGKCPTCNGKGYIKLNKDSMRQSELDKIIRIEVAKNNNKN